MSQTTSKVRVLTEGAILVAMTVILSLFQPFSLPFGGGITIASMLPIVYYSWRRGVKAGLLAGFVFSIANILLGFHTVSAMFLPGDERQPLFNAICIILLDYVVAYTVIGLGGMFRNKLKPTPALMLGALVALSLRYLSHILSGFLFFGAWAEWFFTQDSIGAFGAYMLSNFSGNMLAFLYSVIYNGTYMIPEIIITVLLCLPISKVKKLTERNS